MKVLLGITGSVAATLTPKMVREFQNNGHDVHVILTESSKHFIDVDTLKSLLCPLSIWDDKREFPLNPDWINDDGTMFIPHIFLKDWADVFVIVPLTANTLAKISTGIADNLLTCTFRAWNMSKSIVLAPAMNTDMWKHPITKKNLWDLQQNFFVQFNTNYTGGVTYSDESISINKKSSSKIYMVMPVAKKLACGAEGVGALAPINEIVDLVGKL